MIGWLRGGQSAVVNGDPRVRRRQCSELTRPASMTDGSSSNSVLEEEATTASLSPGLGGDGSGSAVAGHGKQSGGGNGGWSRAAAQASSRATVEWHFSLSRC
jgi:hypothetical protein